MQRKILSALIISAGVLSSNPLFAQERTTEIKTTTIITETIVKEKIKWTPFRVCVLDFTTIDEIGQKKFLDQVNKQIVIPAQSTLNQEDRESINSVMQGFVRMIDAWDNTKTNSANRNVQKDDNLFNREKALTLYRTTVKGQARPTIIGADYLSAYLGKYSEVFSCVDKSLMAAAMQKLQSQPDFPKDFMLRLAKETGATHLVYGTVSDLRTKTSEFKGYGIQTKSTVYQLDVIVKLVDLVKQSTVYSNVYTGNHQEQIVPGSKQTDNNIFQTLMTAAVQQAAEDFYDVCKPGRKNKISVTPIPVQVRITLSGGMFFKQENAEIYIDGKYAGKGGDTISVVPGTYDLVIKASGYQTKQLKIDIAEKAQNLNFKMEK